MIVTRFLPENSKPTPEQIAQIRAARLLPITYDEDCPALTPETAAAFQRAAEIRDAKKRTRV